MDEFKSWLKSDGTKAPAAVEDVAATVDALKVWEAVAAVPTPRRDAAPAIRWPDDA